MHPTRGPVVGEACEKAACALGSLDSRGASFEIQGGAFWGGQGQPIAGGEGALRLAELLEELGIREISLMPRADAGQVRLLVEALREAKKKGQTGPALVATTRAAGVVDIPLRATAARSLEHGAIRPGEASPNPRLWEGLLEDEEEVEPTRAKSSPQSSEVREYALALLRRGETLETEWQALIVERFRSFLSSLEPEMRRELVEVEPYPGRDALALVCVLAENLGADELLHGVATIQSLPAKPPEPFIEMFRSLRERLAGEDDASRLWLRLAERWELVPELGSAPSEVEDAPQAADEDQPIEPVPRKPEGRTYVDPREASDLAIQVAEIALFVLNGSGGTGPDAAQLMETVEEEMDLLFDAGRLRVLEEAVAAATRTLGSSTAGEPGQLAAKRLLDSASKKQRAGKLLEQIRRRGALHPAALTLLELGGADALDEVLRALVRPLPPEVESALWHFACTRAPAEIAAVLDRRFSGGRREIHPLLRVIEALPVDHRLSLLRRLAGHSDAGVRCRAITALGLSGDGSPETVAEFELGLSDHDPGVRLGCIRNLAEIGTERTRNTLCSFLVGSQLLETGEGELTRLAVEGVVAASNGGCGILISTLDSIPWRRQLEAARRVRLIAPHLERFENPELSRWLKKFRRTPAILISRWVDPRSAAGGEA